MSQDNWIIDIIKNPFTVITIDNFFDDESWDYIQKNVVLNPQDYLSNLSKDGYDNQPWGAMVFDEKDPVIKPYLEEHISLDLMKYFPIQRNYDPDKIKKGYCLNFFNKNFHSPIHHEAPDKLLAVVIYLAPEHNIGTLLYNRSKTIDSVVTWKPNRACIFAPYDNLTWHSFGIFDNSPRYTIAAGIQKTD